MVKPSTLSSSTALKQKRYNGSRGNVLLLLPRKTKCLLVFILLFLTSISVVLVANIQKYSSSSGEVAQTKKRKRLHQKIHHDRKARGKRRKELREIIEEGEYEGAGALRELRDALKHRWKDLKKSGEKSLRDQFEEENPPSDRKRIQNFLQTVRELDSIHYSFNTIPTVAARSVHYDAYNCPYEPHSGYPMAWNVIDVLRNWNPDDIDIPKNIYNGLCIFDWSDANDVSKSLNYRKLEVPFIIKNHPLVMQTVERWNTPDYVNELVGDEPMRVEHSENNHLMFWRNKKEKQKHRHSDVLFSRQKQKDSVEGWKPPTENIELTYEEWYEKAQYLQDLVTNEERKHQNKKMSNNNYYEQAENEHWYFRLTGSAHKSAYLYEELEFFNPLLDPFTSDDDDTGDDGDNDIIRNFMQVDIFDHRGINCRFGMIGNTAEAHYDFSRNFIILFSGLRRYILGHPDQCENMELYPKGHPSERHSRVNWSTIVQELEAGQTDKHRPITKAMVNEIVLQAGDVLYLPTGWFHFIVSLNTNFQCNSRSGINKENTDIFHACGF